MITLKLFNSRGSGLSSNIKCELSNVRSYRSYRSRTGLMRRGPRIPPDYAAVPLVSSATVGESSKSSGDRTYVSSRRKQQTASVSTAQELPVKSGPCDLGSSHELHGASHLGIGAASSPDRLPEERAPIPYAPLLLQWPNAAVLDLVVQQCRSPHDPGLTAMLPCEEPSYIPMADVASEIASGNAGKHLK
jgi:hypothetical protein